MTTAAVSGDLAPDGGGPQLSLRVWVGIIIVAGMLADGVSAGNGLLAADLQLVDPSAAGLTGWSLTTAVTLFGQQPMPFHLVGLLQHLAASLMLLWAARRWTDPVTAGIAAGLFAVWPSGSQAVFSIASSTELLAAVLVLVAIRLAAWPKRPVLQVGGIALAGMVALQASAQALGLPLLLLLIHHRQRHQHVARPNLVSHLAAYGIALAWLLWHLPTWSASMALLDPLRNPLLLQSTTSRILPALDGGWTYARLSLWPFSLSADYGIGVIEMAPSFVTAIWAGVLLACVVTIAWRYHQRADLLSMGLLWWMAALLPVSNVVAPTTRALSEAYLYLPVAGLCLSLSAAVTGVTGRLSATGGWRSPVLWIGVLLMGQARSVTASRGGRLAHGRDPVAVDAGRGAGIGPCPPGPGHGAAGAGCPDSGRTALPEGHQPLPALCHRPLQSRSGAACTESVGRGAGAI